MIQENNQILTTKRENYNIFPYGIWLPDNEPNLIEKLSCVIQVQSLEHHNDILYIDGIRVRTPHDPGSHPCFNCGQCIDNGLSCCRNNNCVKDRKKRGLCYNHGWAGRGKNWIHNVDKELIWKDVKKGVNYNKTSCKYCNFELKWLDDYPQEKHIKDYLKFNKTNRKEYEVKTKSFFYIRSSRTVSGKLRHIIYQRDDYKCRECGATKDEIRLEIDHIIPFSKGGKTELSNLQTLCKICNRSKHTRQWVGGQ